MDSRRFTELHRGLPSVLPAIRAPISKDADDNDTETSVDDEGSQRTDGSARFWSGDEGFESASERSFFVDTEPESEEFHDAVEDDGGALVWARDDAGSSFSGVFWPLPTMVPIAKVSDEAEDAYTESGSDGDGEFHGVVRVSTEEEVGVIDGNLVSEEVESTVKGDEDDGEVLDFYCSRENPGVDSYPVAKTTGSAGIGVMKVEKDEENSKLRIHPVVDAIESDEIGSVENDSIKASLESMEQSNIVAKRENIEFDGCKTSLGVAGEDGVGHGVEGEESVGIVDQVLDSGHEIVADESETSSNGDDEDTLEKKRVTGSEARDGATQKLNFAEELEKFVNTCGSSDGRVPGDGLATSDSDEAVGAHEDEDDEKLFDFAALTTLLKAAMSTSPPNANKSYQANSSFVSSEGPAGLGSSLPSLRPCLGRRTQSDVSEIQSVSDDMDEEEKNHHEKINNLRVKFLRLIHRLGYSPKEPITTQVLYRLSLCEKMPRRRTSVRHFSIDAAHRIARKLEEDGNTDLDFSCTMLILGKTGVGKSATINSIFGEEKTRTNAFQSSTFMVREVTGIVNGVKLRMIDTPGLRTSVMEQSTNKKILSSVKRFMKNFPPDIVVYVDRIDAIDHESNDLPLLQSVASNLGPSILSNAIVAFTHASCAPPDGPNGAQLRYETFIQNSLNSLQNSIRWAVSDMHLVNQMVLVENHPSCRLNQDGHWVLPNGQSWLPHLLMVCYSRKMLLEANALLKLPHAAAGKSFFSGSIPHHRSPLPFLLSTLLQSRSHPRVAAADEGDENLDSEDELSDADEYDELPPFKPLPKSQIAKLSKEQRKAYFEEYDYRVMLLQKKQLKEERRHGREQKKHRGEATLPEASESEHEDVGGVDIQEPMPKTALPPTFDGDSPAFRYRHLARSQLLAGPLLNNQVWDHDCGYDGISLEENLLLAGRFPAGFSGQIIKDKSEFNIHMDSYLSVKHGDHGATVSTFDVQTVGRQLAYIFRNETEFKNFKKNKTAAGLILAQIGDSLASGIKLEDRISLGKRAILRMAAGAIRSRSDLAYGASLEARFLNKDHPISQDATTLGLSLMQWRESDLALGANLQTQFSVGRCTKSTIQIGLNSKPSGQIKVTTSSLDQLQFAVMCILPVVGAIFRHLRDGEAKETH